jgi:hypothetical protein
MLATCRFRSVGPRRARKRAARDRRSERYRAGPPELGLRDGGA